MLRGRRQGRGQGLGMMLLVMQLLNVGLENIPPVTLATIFGNAAIFLGLFDVKYPSIGQVCVSVVNVWYRRDWQRLLLAAFFHVDEWHLYYNMASFLWKGISLEKRLGSVYFAYLITVFSVLVNCTLLLLDLAAARIYENDHYLASCAVGFSGVIFALKVVTTHYLPPGIQYIMGVIPVPSRIACWVELGIIQLLVPNASFTGHLAGILVGLAYVKGPIKYIMDCFISPAHARRFTNVSRASGWRPFRGSEFNQSQGYNLRGNSSRYDSDVYTGGLSEEEQFRRAMEESTSESISIVPVTHFTEDLSEEEGLQTAVEQSKDGPEDTFLETVSMPRKLKTIKRQGDVAERILVDEESNDEDPSATNLSYDGASNGHEEMNFDQIQELISLGCSEVLDALSQSKLEHSQLDEPDSGAMAVTTSLVHNDEDNSVKESKQTGSPYEERFIRQPKILTPAYVKRQRSDNEKMNGDDFGNFSTLDMPSCGFSNMERCESQPCYVNGGGTKGSMSTYLNEGEAIPSDVNHGQNGSPTPIVPRAQTFGTNASGRLLSPDELRQRRLAKLDKDQLWSGQKQGKPKASRLPVKLKS